jgi:hypothetical protein
LSDIKIDHEEEIRKIKNSFENSIKNDHLNELSFEMCMEMENQLRLNYEQVCK